MTKLYNEFSYNKFMLNSNPNRSPCIIKFILEQLYSVNTFDKENINFRLVCWLNFSYLFYILI